MEGYLGLGLHKIFKLKNGDREYIKQNKRVVIIFNIRDYKWDLLIFRNSIVPVFIIIHTYLAQTSEIGQGLGLFLSCGARRQEQT